MSMDLCSTTKLTINKQNGILLGEIRNTVTGQIVSVTYTALKTIMTCVGFLADARELLLTTEERMSVGSSSRPRRVRTMKRRIRQLCNTNVRKKMEF